MTLKFNNTDVDNVLFNGTQLEELQLNGVTVWTHTQPVPSGTVIFESGTTGTYDVTIPAAGEYYCTVVGAGGGAALSMHTTADGSAFLPSVGSLICGGGTGGYIKATVRFDSAMALKVYVGSKGEGKHIYRLNQKSAQTWYANGGVGENSVILCELTKIVMRAFGGGRGMISGKLATSVSGGPWYTDFTYSTGAGGGWAWNNQTGITVFNVTAAQGNDGTLAADGSKASAYGSFTATVPVLLAPNMVSGNGAGGGGTCTTNRVQGSTDNSNWNYSQGTYGPNDGYVKIVKT